MKKTTTTITQQCPCCNYIYQVSIEGFVKKVVKGKEPFQRVAIPYSVDEPSWGRKGVDKVFSGAFCPKCGVFININICTRKEQK